MRSDNPGGADNQQERLITTGWVVGFVDGEGCFSIGFVRQPHRHDRRGYRAGYQVFHRFVVTQGARSAGCLRELQEFFGAGRIYVNRRHDNHKEDLHQYIVGRRNELIEFIVPFFREHPLRTSKREDFEKFVVCLERISAGDHLRVRGLVEIAEIAETMNHRKSRQDLIRILRGHTPNIRDTG
jgi:LAGLIDADG endonuclease